MKRGISIACTVCGRTKFPRGRSAPSELYGSRCDDRCAGYRLDPKPGDLWPGETEEDFGYPVSPNATEEIWAAADELEGSDA